ncbi:hypothetical protein CU669_17010 [Paramagnetospirillum kuznetsovii]|uniref:DUF2934 domain-containing protein n=1 Tax=Paramagnetospirillum kuznetsovii TaxID=2053833 RepID=A0A364NUM3_9PROT|nr:DUF2934 domain-containing protein [Paramagnetospirillum kuznetsovii]RAU20778.1 hypothetical protein CU669_17010 [Paramagnetospirillum kuznetsovii]
MTHNEARVREMARILWEKEGRPEGHDLELWCKAEQWILREAAYQGKVAQQIITFPCKSAPLADKAQTL